MKPLLGTLAIAAVTTVALGTASAQAENASWEQRAQLDRLWNPETATDSGPPTVRRNFYGGADRRAHDRQRLSGPWADNFRGGHKHPPAGN